MKTLPFLLACLVSATFVVAADDEKDFKPLFKGKDMTGWHVRRTDRPSSGRISAIPRRPTWASYLLMTPTPAGACGRAKPGGLTWCMAMATGGSWPLLATRRVFRMR